MDIFQVFYDFFGGIFRFLLETLNSYGLAIIAFTFITRVVFIYFNGKARLSTLRMQRLQPKLKELEKKYKGDKVKYQQATQAFYQKEGISPMGGCLWSLLPFPIMIILYGILQNPLKYIVQLGDKSIDAIRNVVLNLIGKNEIQVSEAVNNALQNAATSHLHLTNVIAENADKVSNALANTGAVEGVLVKAAENAQTIALAAGNSKAVEEAVNAIANAPEMATELAKNAGQLIVDGKLSFGYEFLGLNMLATPESYGIFHPIVLIPILAALATYLASWCSQKFSGMQQASNMKGMLIFMPLISLYFAYTMPAGIGIYWIAGSVYAIVQDYFLTKKYRKVLDVEDAKKAELEARRIAAEAAMKEESRQRRAEAIASGKKKNTSYRLKRKPEQSNEEKED